jgi:hypothetical protein
MTMATDRRCAECGSGFLVAYSNVRSADLCHQCATGGRRPEQRNGHAEPLAGFEPPRLSTRPVPAREFLANAGDPQPDVVAPLVSPKINFLVGNVGEGKTHLATEIAVTKACGRSRIGLAATPGPVLIVQSDMGDEFVGALAMHVGVDRTDALDNIHVWVESGILLDDDAIVEEFLASVRAVRPELMVVDYFDLFHGTDGATNRQLRPILNVLKELRDVDGIPQLWLDQTRKAAEGPKSEAPLIDKLIGGRPKSAVASRAYFISRDKASGVFTVTSAKRRSAEFAPIRLMLDDQGWQRIEGEPVRLTQAEEQVRQCVLEGSPRTIESIQNRTGLAERTVRGALTRLQYHGDIAHGPKDGRAFTYVPANSANGAANPANAEFDGFANSAANPGSPLGGTRRPVQSSEACERCGAALGDDPQYTSTEETTCRPCALEVDGR